MMVASPEKGFPGSQAMAAALSVASGVARCKHLPTAWDR
jgi:hypothetical protein